MYYVVFLVVAYHTNRNVVSNIAEWISDAFLSMADITLEWSLHLRICLCWMYIFQTNIYSVSKK